jgi:arginase
MEIAIVCVPYQIDMARWGYARGPQALLDAGLIEELRAHGHHVGEPVWIELPRAERTRDVVTNLGRIAARTSAAVRDALRQTGGFALVLEGDCTHAVGAIGGLAQASGEAGVAWFDAHGDLNTMETSESGYIGGVPYAVALGWEFDDWREAAGLARAVRVEAAALLGTSDLDAAEVEALRRHPILHLTAGEVGQAGGPQMVETALHARAGEAQAWYLHVDVDVAGPQEVPGAMTPAPHWPPRDRLIAAIAAAARTLPVRVASLATYNPAGDPTGRGARFTLDVGLAIADAVAGTR